MAPKVRYSALLLLILLLTVGATGYAAGSDRRRTPLANEQNTGSDPSKDNKGSSGRIPDSVLVGIHTEDIELLDRIMRNQAAEEADGPGQREDEPETQGREETPAAAEETPAEEPEENEDKKEKKAKRGLFGRK